MSSRAKVTLRSVRTVTIHSLILYFLMYSSRGGSVLVWHVTVVNTCVSFLKEKTFSLKKTLRLKTHLFHSFKGAFFFVDIFSLVFFSTTSISSSVDYSSL